jgi:hypothetical protein
MQQEDVDRAGKETVDMGVREMLAWCLVSVTHTEPQMPSPNIRQLAISVTCEIRDAISAPSENFLQAQHNDKKILDTLRDLPMALHQNA